MSKTMKTNAEETRIAEQIMSVLPQGSFARACSDDRDAIRFTVDTTPLKLRTVVLDRDSLNRLQSDPARAIKIEYLQRDLLRSAMRRAEFRYPRITRLVRKSSRDNRLRLAALAVASIAR